MTRYLLVTETRYTERMSYVLWKLLAQVGIKRTECEVLPLLGSEKPKGAYGRIPAAQMAEILPKFREKLQQTNADVLIPMGGTAFRAITGLGKGWGITSIAGYVVTADDCEKIPMSQEVHIGNYKRDNKKKGIKKGDPRFAVRRVPQDPVLPRGCRWIVPSLDLSTVIKLRYKNITQFRAAFQNAKRLLSGEPLLDERFIWQDTLPDSIPVGGWTSYDIEAQFESTDIERISIANENGTWTLPWGIDEARAMQAALDCADVLIAHNQQFDIPILAHHGVHVPQPQFDTMLAAALIEPDLLKGLDSVAPVYLLLKPWKHLSAIRGFADPEYSAKDAFVERELGLVLQAKLEELEMSDLFNKVMMPAVPVLMDMKQQGIKLDVKRTADWCLRLSKQLEMAQQKWVERHPETNPSSPKQLQDLLYGTWKLPVQRRKGDGISTDALALRVLKKKAPKHTEDLDLLLEIREVQKLLGTYGKAALGKERVHPSYLPASKDSTDARSGKGLAATGRIATSHPNIQNQPSEARIMYVPDTDNDCFIERDWRQAELRVGAALSNDEVMLAALEDDIHGRTMELMGCDRTRAKNCLFGSAYGAGPKKLKETLEAQGYEATEEECRRLQLGLARAYPKWWAWRQTIADLAKSQQWLRNPFGRLRRFPHDRDIPAALDYLPQSVVADAMWSVLPELHDAMVKLNGRLVTVVHDSFLLQVPKEAVDSAAQRSQYILEQPFEQVAHGFVLPSSLKIGKPGASWGELSE